MSTILPVLVMVVLFGVVYLWLIMLADAWKKKRAGWVVGMVFLGPVGAVFYYVIAHKQSNV